MGAIPGKFKSKILGSQQYSRGHGWGLIFPALLAWNFTSVMVMHLLVRKAGPLDISLAEQSPDTYRYHYCH